MKLKDENFVLEDKSLASCVNTVLCVYFPIMTDSTSVCQIYIVL